MTDFRVPVLEDALSDLNDNQVLEEDSKQSQRKHVKLKVHHDDDKNLNIITGHTVLRYLLNTLKEQSSISSRIKCIGICILLLIDL